MPEQHIDSQESITISGYGFKIIIGGNDKPEIFNDKNEIVTDIGERIAIQEKLVLPFIQKLNTSWKQEIINLATYTQKLNVMSIGIKETTHLVQIKDYQTQRQFGAQEEDGSYYAGQDAMGQDFFFWLENISTGQIAPGVVFNSGTKILLEKYIAGETFRGHSFSAFQLDGKGHKDEIRNAIKNNTFDYGLHRPRADQAELIQHVFNSKPEMRIQALDMCSKYKSIQTATLGDNGKNCVQTIRSGSQNSFSCTNNCSHLLVGYSAPVLKI